MKYIIFIIIKNNIMGNSNNKNNYLSPIDELNNWKNDLLSDPRSEFIINASFENILYYAEASVFFNKNENESIGIRTYKKSNLSYKENNSKINDECSICFNKLQSLFKKKYTTLECNHSFHTKCFEKYVKTKKNECQIISCPLCRCGISPDEDEIARLKKKETRTI